MDNNTTNATRVGKRVVRFFNWIVDCIVLVILVLLIIFAGYSLWDNEAMYAEGSSKQYETYKPTSDNSLSFEELQDANPDVGGWLTIYGTSIDYPIVKSQDSNDEYLSKNALGEITGSGSIFMDYRNDVNFTDFNTILYGHHMEHSSMFGDLDKFVDEEFFESRQYGDLYYGGTHHGLEIIAVIQADAYDELLYIPAVAGEENQRSYISYIAQTAKYTRGLENVTPAEHLLLMSTCSSDVTNGRFILVARITDQTYDNQYAEEDAERLGSGIDAVTLWARIKSLPSWIWMLVIFFIIIVIYLLYMAAERRRYRRMQKKNEISAKEGLPDD